MQEDRKAELKELIIEMIKEGYSSIEDIVESVSKKTNGSPTLEDFSEAFIELIRKEKIIFHIVFDYETYHAVFGFPK